MTKLFLSLLVAIFPAYAWAGLSPLFVTANQLQGFSISDTTPSNGQVLTFNTSTNAWEPRTISTSSGTVTSVAATVPSYMSLSGSPITTSGTLAFNFSSQAANKFFSSPNGVSGVPSFRVIVAADIPTLNQNTTGTASNVTGVVALINGGTGQTTSSAAFGALSPLTTKGDLVGYSTINARVPIGTNGQVLTADSAEVLGLKWASPASSGANTTLSNLVNTVAVPNGVALSPANDQGANLGSASNRWDVGYIYTLKDGSDVSSIETNLRVLDDNSGNPSVSWNGRNLTDVAGFDSLNWDARFLANTSGTSVLNWSALTTGTAGQFLQTDGSGNASWASAGGSPTGDNNTLAYFNSSGNLDSNTSAKFTDSNNSMSFAMESGGGTVSAGTGGTQGALAFGVSEGGDIKAFNGGYGNMAFGYAIASGSAIKSEGNGGLAFGVADGATGLIQTNAFDGSLAFGSVTNASITTNSFGAMAFGLAGSAGLINVSNYGAIAHGYASDSGTIIASGIGSLAQGDSQNPGSQINADARGAIASGYAANGGQINANGHGSLAIGQALDTGQYVQAGANASYALGDTDSGFFINITQEGSLGGGAAYTGSIVVSQLGAIAWGDDITLDAELGQAFGLGHINDTYLTNVVGRYSVTPTAGNENTWVSTDPLFVVGNGASSGSRNNALTVLKNGHVIYSGTTPAVSACGTTPSPSIAGNDRIGRVTVGGGVVTSCTITFAYGTWTNAPVCVLNDESTTLLVRASATTTVLTISGASLTGDTIGWHCDGY